MSSEPKHEKIEGIGEAKPSSVSTHSPPPPEKPTESTPSPAPAPESKKKRAYHRRHPNKLKPDRRSEIERILGY